MFLSHQQYKNSSPFPNIVIDNFFSDEELTQCMQSILDNINNLEWKQQDYHFQVNKRWLEDIVKMPLEVKKIMWQLHSTEFLCFLKDLTGIKGIIDDPLNIGGGIHCTGACGKLNIHKDFNYNKETGLTRKINVLVFLNKEWRPEWNGNLELWSRDRSQKVKEIPPNFNKMVIFNTDEDSYHGCPAPLECPDDRFRLSLATYYYIHEENLDESQQRHHSEFYD
tara:strand:- start:5433 stop:6101 length:669 start_codon:yes stop_codon:yes gene_type:complete